MVDVISMDSLDLSGKRVLVRVDFNVPVEKGVVTSDIRIQAELPTIRALRDAGAKVMLMSHLGRPKEGQYDAEFSLAPVATKLSALLGQSVRLEQDWLSGVDLTASDIVLCENVRFNEGEKSNEDGLARQMAALCDVFVMDAFATAHRAQASTHGVAKYAPIACAGPLLLAELSALTASLEHPKRPLVAIVGGSKVSTKLTILQSLSEKVDQLIVGGGIANTFLAATGQPVGQSLYEPDLVDEAKGLLQDIQQEGGFIPLPVDVRVAKTFAQDAMAEVKDVADVEPDERILDIGPQTEEALSALLRNAGTIIWNGPVGVFEFENFGSGTQALANAIAKSPAYSIAGGGDTLAAIDQYGVADDMSYISTGGGAFLEYVEGKTLPAIEILTMRANEQ